MIRKRTLFVVALLAALATIAAGCSPFTGHADPRRPVADPATSPAIDPAAVAVRSA